MPELQIKSCAHCGGKPSIVCQHIGPEEHYVTGWECVGCGADISTVCVGSMVSYTLRKMGMRWNMRAEIKEENFTSYNSKCTKPSKRSK